MGDKHQPTEPEDDSTSRQDEEAATQFTQLLDAWNNGDQAAFSQLFALLYDELKRRAKLERRRQPKSGYPYTVQTTALVHEVYMRLVGQHSSKANTKEYFLNLAAIVMRRFLVDHYRASQTDKRGAGAPHIELIDAGEIPKTGGVDVLALDEALTRLEKIDPDQGKIIELRFFGELTIKDTADVMHVSEATIKRETRLALAWLHKNMNS